MSPSTIPPLNDAKSQTPCTGFPDPEKAFKVDRSQTFDVESVQLNGGIAVRSWSYQLIRISASECASPDTVNITRCVIHQVQCK